MRNKETCLPETTMVFATCYTRRVTSEMCHLKCDMWHVTCDRWHVTLTYSTNLRKSLCKKIENTLWMVWKAKLNVFFYNLLIVLDFFKGGFMVVFSQLDQKLSSNLALSFVIKTKNALSNYFFWQLKDITLGAYQKSWMWCFFSKTFILVCVFAFYNEVVI